MRGLRGRASARGGTNHDCNRRTAVRMRRRRPRLCCKRARWQTLPPPAPRVATMLHFMAAFVSAQATCSSTPCAGGNAGCGGNLCLGDGDCDADTDCATGLLCGTDNCGAFRSSAGWPHDGPGWDMTDDCCYSPGGLGSPTPMTLSFHTCDIADGQTNGQTLLHTSENLPLE